MLDRRQLLASLAATGIGTSALHRAIASGSQEAELTVESIKEAEWITDLELTDEEREGILSAVERTNSAMAELRKQKLEYTVPMGVQFAPTAGLPQVENLARNATPVEGTSLNLPTTEEQIAFLPLHELAGLVKARLVSSTRLTKIYLARLKKFGPMLRCVVTLTEASALARAKQADEEIAAGNYRGPLHGIPWGAKDLIAIKGFPTTWGIPYHEKRKLDHTATVAERVEAAGAVLVAKLSLGALAQGDKWFRGVTRNPWNPEQGSSGSSAGSASAVIGGLVGFTLGSETLGSIISPSRRCGASSLRPTFGRVSRDGCMPLSWSLDKIGPICRSVEDCALVFDAIHGADGRDMTAGSFPFHWPSQKDLKSLKVGYQKSQRRPDEEREDLKILNQMGCQLVEVDIPRASIPFSSLFSIIDVEAASVFDDLLRAGHTDGWNTWTNSFRSAQYVSAVDYVKVQRARTVLMKEYGEAIKGVDCCVNVNDLVQTNFTGHPSVVLPIAYTDRDNGGKRPSSVIFTGHLNDDERLLAIAQKFQAIATANQEHPNLEPWLKKFTDGNLKDPA